MRKKLVTCASYLDGEYLWCYDEIICALSKINTTTLQAECVVSPMQIPIDEEFKVRKIIGWKNKIIVLPVHINKKWVVYDKVKGEIQYIDFYKKDYVSSEVFLVENNLIFLPIFVKDPIVIVDLMERKIIYEISFQFPEINTKNTMHIWDGKINQKAICFFIRGSSVCGRLNENGLNLMNLKSLALLKCADFYEMFIWGVDECGENLYQFNEKGNLLQKYMLNSQIKYTRIVAEEKSVFLLPEKGRDILQFDINTKSIKNIKDSVEKILFDFPETVKLMELPVYWDYIKNNSDIWFLQLKSHLKRINLSTLECKQQPIEYSDEFSGNLYKKYLKYARELKRRLIVNEDLRGLDCEEYLKILNRQEIDERKRKEMLLYGSLIWKRCNENAIQI